MSTRTALITANLCRRESRYKSALDKECLEALITSDEHGMYIGHSVETIINNRRMISEQCRSANPDTKKVARANENIMICMNSIKTRLTRLGANQGEIDQVIDKVNESDFQAVTLLVLELMVRKNPGMNKRKYNQALQIIAANQKQSQH